jgi:putative SOS response-associated peptidase YedK
MFPAMCGRYSADLRWDDVAKLYDLSKQGPLPPWNFPPSYNVCPTDPVPVIIPNFDRRQLVVMRWGLVPGWWSKPLKELRLATFNARAETVEEKPFFREAFKRSRCLIPASGYYEWHYSNPDDKKEKPQPYYFSRRDGQLITFAGLYDTWHDRAENKTSSRASWSSPSRTSTSPKFTTACQSYWSPINSIPGCGRTTCVKPPAC